jgi:hypothetical protein
MPETAQGGPFRPELVAAVIRRDHCQRCTRAGTQLEKGVCTGPDLAECEAIQPPLIPIEAT